MQKIWIQSGFYSLCLTLFLLPFNPLWSRYSSALFIVFGLFAWTTGFNSYLSSVKKRFHLLLPFVLYFLLHIIKYDNDTRDWSLIERQLLFFFLPLMGFPVFMESFSRRKRIVLITAFISGTFAAILLLLSRAALIHFEVINSVSVPINSIDASEGSFMASALSYFQHPSYFSIGINISIVLIVLFGKELPVPAVARWPLIFFLSLILILLSSRAGLAGLAISAFVMFVIKLIKTENKKAYFLTGSALLIILVPLSLLLNPGLKDSVNRITDNIRKEGKLNLGEVEPRANVWSSSKDLIADRIFTGYGVNEGKQKLINEYRKNGYYSEAFFTLNCHNQFLETQLAFGLPGSLVLILMIFAGLFNRRNKSLLQFQIVFIILIIIHFMFESMLVRQWGIMIFTYFSCILNLTDNDDLSGREHSYA